MAIVSMGSSGQIITEPIGDKGELRRQLKDMEPENGGGGQGGGPINRRRDCL